MLINKTVLYVAEAASLLNCPTRTIYGLIHTGMLKAYKNPGGNSWHIPETALQEYVDNRINERYPAR